MGAPLADFEVLMDRVMAQAASFDAEQIAAAQKALVQWCTPRRLGLLSSAQRHQVRARLHAYRELSEFLQATLHAALVSAGHIQGAGYSGRGAPAPRSQPLMRRYG